MACTSGRMQVGVVGVVMERIQVNRVKRAKDANIFACAARYVLLWLAGENGLGDLCDFGCEALGGG